MIERLFLECAVRAMLLAAGTAGVLGIMRVKTAQVKHAAWSGVMLLMLALPVWMAWGPKTSFPILPTAPVRTSTQAVLLLDRAIVAPVPAHASPRIPTEPAMPNRDWRAYGIGIYLLGVCVMLARLAIGTAKARALLQSATGAEIRTSAACSAPVTVGWLHPAVILPEGWQQWPPTELQAVLMHEREHARRRDPLVKWLAHLNRAAFWFHPLAWWLDRNLATLAEEACDAAALASGANPQEYCESLLRFARLVANRGARIQVWGMAMSGSPLAHRIRQILNASPPPRISRVRLASVVAACGITFVLFTTGRLNSAYQDETTRPAFEVASIRPDKRTDGPTPGGVLPGGKFFATRWNLRELIQYAYHVEPYRLSGGPGWVDSEGYTIEAKAEPGAIAPGALDRAKIHQLALMLQSLLANRFHLKVHRETKEGPIYALLLAKGGPRLQEVKGDCPAEASPSNPRCGDFTRFSGRGFVIGPRVSVLDLAELLSGFIVNQPVVDKTGIKGNFNINLQWTPDRFRNQEGPTGGREPGPDPNGPSLFTAIQEQLGLRLEAQKGPIEFLVIDSADRPSAN